MVFLKSNPCIAPSPSVFNCSDKAAVIFHTRKSLVISQLPRGGKEKYCQQLD